jgi:transaldolase
MEHFRTLALQLRQDHHSTISCAQQAPVKLSFCVTCHVLSCTFAADAMLSRAQSLLSLYAEMGVPKDKLIMRVPATWAGIQAAAALEKQGIATQAFHIYRCGWCTSC